MQLFLDTASVAEIRTMWEVGILDGVTTNPTLVAKEGRKFEDVLREVCALGVPSVSAEVVATDTEGMLREGRHLREIHPAIYVKVPMTPAGLTATKVLAKDRLEGASLLGDQGRVRRDPVQDPELPHRLDLGDARRVEEQLHRVRLLWPGTPDP